MTAPISGTVDGRFSSNVNQCTSDVVYRTKERVSHMADQERFLDPISSHVWRTGSFSYRVGQLMRGHGAVRSWHNASSNITNAPTFSNHCGGDLLSLSPLCLSFPSSPPLILARYLGMQCKLCQRVRAPGRQMIFGAFWRRNPSQLQNDNFTFYLIDCM